ncbi:hypothetical protein WJ97_14015 [Burkholderia ubonensis]|uniref:hypothetical protein n=1 Tax=Burkholderia ubonensis TaxID=101571 RepID=UPI000756015B|nr:hypothetical protein [Burkholderia ubonensis]KVP96932.1 hypothetical protein WJ97_14015 [Burkholderia ubonensis]
MRRSTLLLGALAGAIMLSGCGNDPNPSPDLKANYEGTRFAVTKAGATLEVEGCQVSVHRVTTANSDALNDFTMAVAKCPTATVTATEYGCGKSCHANNIVVKPVGPTIEMHEVSREAAMQAARLQAAAARKSAQVMELRAEVDRLSRELNRLEAGGAQ